MPPVARSRPRTVAPSTAPLDTTAPKGPGAIKEFVLVYRDPHELKASPIKLRRRSRRQQEHLIQNLRRFPCVLPILTNSADVIICGHGIAEAAKAIDLERVPTIRLEGLSDAEARALRISINKIEELSTWDEGVLKSELAFLVDYDLELASFTAFSSAEVDAILNAPQDPDEPFPSSKVFRLHGAATSGS